MVLIYYPKQDCKLYIPIVPKYFRNSYLINSTKDSVFTQKIGGFWITLGLVKQYIKYPLRQFLNPPGRVCLDYLTLNSITFTKWRTRILDKSLSMSPPERRTLLLISYLSLKKHEPAIISCDVLLISKARISFTTNTRKINYFWHYINQ